MNRTYFSTRHIYKLVAASILSLVMLLTFLPPSAEALYSHNAHLSNCIHHHKIKQGETLSEISVYHGLPLRRLAKANHIHNPDYIIAGQWLCIPQHLGHGPKRGHHKPIMHHHPCHGSHHIVKHGDTLSEIAKYNGVSLYTLAHKNHIRNIDHIRVGQKLCLPHYH